MLPAPAMKTVKLILASNVDSCLRQLWPKLQKANTAPLTHIELVGALLNGGMDFFGFFEDEILLGGAAVKPTQTEKGRTAFVYAFFGDGVATKAFGQLLVSALKDAGFTYLRGEGSEAAYRLYKSCGIGIQKECIVFGASL